jgi:hypothetical protein
LPVRLRCQFKPGAERPPPGRDWARPRPVAGGRRARPDGGHSAPARLSHGTGPLSSASHALSRRTKWSAGESLSHLRAAAGRKTSRRVATPEPQA